MTKAWLLPGAVVRLHDWDLHAVGWGGSPWALVIPIKAIRMVPIYTAKPGSIKYLDTLYWSYLRVPDNWTDAVSSKLLGWQPSLVEWTSNFCPMLCCMERLSTCFWIISEHKLDWIDCKQVVAKSWTFTTVDNQKYFCKSLNLNQECNRIIKRNGSTYLPRLLILNLIISNLIN